MTSHLTRSQSLKPTDDSQADHQLAKEKPSSDESARNVTIQSKLMTVGEMQTYFDSKFDQLFQGMATKSFVDKLLKVITVQRNRIDELESKVSVIDSLITQLKNNVDDQEQYQRINGIPPPQGGQTESGEEFLEKVKTLFKNQLDLHIPDTVIDHAHRIGGTKVIDG